MNHTVLLVDDEPHVIRVMQMGLRRAGYEVITARNGLEGLERFRELQPDAMVADIDMPKMNGVEMCTTICQEFPDSGCKMLVSTSRAEVELRTWALNTGSIEFLEKPISIRTLTAELETFFKSANDGSC